MRPRVVAPVADQVRRAQHGRDVVRQHAVEVEHPRLQQAAGADDVGRLAQLVVRRKRAGGTCRCMRGSDVGQRLAVAVLQVGADEPRQRAVAAAGGEAALAGAVIAFRAVLVEGLQRLRLLERDFGPVRLPRGDAQDAADRIAGVGGGERSVQHVEMVDGLRRDHAPARRADAVVVGDQRGYRDVVDEHQRARAGIDAPGARGERRLRIAEVALAEEHARQVSGGVLHVDGIDRVLDAFAVDGGLRGGEFRRSIAGALAFDADGVECAGLFRGIGWRFGHRRSIALVDSDHRRGKCRMDGKQRGDDRQRQARRTRRRADGRGHWMDSGKHKAARHVAARDGRTGQRRCLCVRR